MEFSQEQEGLVVVELVIELLVEVLVEQRQLVVELLGELEVKEKMDVALVADVADVAAFVGGNQLDGMAQRKDPVDEDDAIVQMDWKEREEIGVARNQLIVVVRSQKLVAVVLVLMG